MHDINKELEKFFRLLEEAESSPEKDAGAPVSDSSTPTERSQTEPTPLPDYSVSGQQDLESRHTPPPRPIRPTQPPAAPPTPQQNFEAAGPNAGSTPVEPPRFQQPSRPANPPQSSKPRVQPTPIPPGGKASAAGSESSPTNGRSFPDQSAVPPGFETTGSSDSSANTITPRMKDYPSSARETHADSLSNLDQLMQEVRGKLNQPARSRDDARSLNAGSDRSAASIIVDAPLAAGSTPSWRKGVLTGLAIVLPACLVLAIILNKPGELGPSQVNIDSPVVEQASELPAQQAELSMNSNPPGARIFLDGELFGVTPFESIRIKPGTYTVTAEVPGFASLDTTLTLRARHWITLNIGESAQSDAFYASNDGAQDHILAGIPSSDENNDLAEESIPEEVIEAPRQNETRREEAQRPATPPRPTTGSIAFTSEPEGAQVFLDNKLQGVTPFSMSSVSGGRHSVRYSLDGYEDYTTGLDLTPGIRTPLHGELSPAFGTVVLNVEDTGSVFIDGSLTDTDVSGNRTYELPPGSHTIAVQRSGMVPWEMTVTVSSGESQSIQVEKPDSGFDNMFAEAQQLYSRGEYQAAKETFQRAREMQPGNRLVVGKIAEIDRLLQAERTQELTEAIIENGVYLITDTPPKLVGGLEELHKRVRYPEAAYQAGVTGRVYIQFVVNEDGTASDFSVTKGLPLGCNEEAIRAIRNAQFEPAKFEGRTVKARHTLFVNFDQ
ncbi:MAG: TonB family protein [Rhodothermales bacterium]|nr:TonB family protein [Rhodothermales bacterium]